MRSTLAFGFVASLGCGIWIAACGGSGDTSSDLTQPDSGPETSTPPPPPPPAGDAPNDSPVSASCDSKTATACAPRKCDPNLGCVTCTADADCVAAGGGNPFCILGRCEACRTNADCGVAAPVCFPADHRCHLSCTGDAAVPCTGDTPLCDATTGACVGCKTNTDCPATAPICEATTKTCGQCAASSDCPAAKPRCDFRSFLCVQCVTSVDCPSGQACNGEGRCVVPCTGDGQCTSPTPKCDVPIGTCVQCLANPDCTSPTASKCDPVRDRCVQCLLNTDCDADAGTPFCDKNLCVQCKKDQDCPGPDPKCDGNKCR